MKDRKFYQVNENDYGILLELENHFNSLEQSKQKGIQELDKSIKKIFNTAITLFKNLLSYSKEIIDELSSIIDFCKFCIERIESKSPSIAKLDSYGTLAINLATGYFDEAIKYKPNKFSAFFSHFDESINELYYYINATR